MKIALASGAVAVATIANAILRNPVESTPPLTNCPL